MGRADVAKIGGDVLSSVIPYGHQPPVDMYVQPLLYESHVSWTDRTAEL